jgi:hypothetical protein
VISLLGMLVSSPPTDLRLALTALQAGSAVVAYIATPAATWATLLFLLALHLCLNYLAVRSVTMHSLNRQRANLVFSHLLAHDKVLTPAQVSRLEVVFERDGVLRWLGAEVLGRATIGVGMQELVLAGGGKGGDGSGPDLYELHELFRDEEYLLCANATGTAVAMALRRGCSARGQLRAWLHALVLAREASEQRGRGPSSSAEKEKGGDRARAAVTSSLTRTRAVWGEFAARLASAGWALDEAALETGCGPRIGVAVERPQ